MLNHIIEALREGNKHEKIFAKCSFCYSWDGYDYEACEDIEIEKGNLVRSGREIEVYHRDTGEYHNEEVIDVDDDEVETYDYDTGEYRTYDMD